MSQSQSPQNRWEQNWSISSKERRTQIIDGERSIEIVQEYRILLGEIPISAVRSYGILGPTKPPVVLIHGFAQNRYTLSGYVKDNETGEYLIGATIYLKENLQLSFLNYFLSHL